MTTKEWSNMSPEQKDFCKLLSENIELIHGHPDLFNSLLQILTSHEE